MKKPTFERGNYRVMRWCCQSGNCFECRHLGYGKRKRVTQTDQVSKAWAQYVAENWQVYGATAEKMETTPDDAATKVR